MISKRLRRRVYEERAELGKLRPIPQNYLENIRERYDSTYIYHSNAIEGNTLTKKETILLLERGITVGGKSFKEHLEAKNHKEALKYLYELVSQKKPITEELIFKLHSILMNGVIPEEQVGKYRDRGVIIRGALIQPPIAQDVSEKMENLIYLINNNPEDIPFFEFCAQIHAIFEHIHPFSDGNGRTGRLLLNLMLMQREFLPIIIKKTDRITYLNALSKADHGYFDHLINFLLKYEEEQLIYYLEMLTPNYRPPKYEKLSEIAKELPYSAAYLNLLIRNGNIPAKKEGKVWYTTKEAVQKYIKSITS